MVGTSDDQVLAGPWPITMRQHEADPRGRQKMWRTSALAISPWRKGRATCRMWPWVPSVHGTAEGARGLSKRKRHRHSPDSGGGRATTRRAPRGHPPWGAAVSVAVALLIGVTPLFRGLYFPTQQLWAVIAAAVVLGAVWLTRPPSLRRLIRGPLDWAAWAVPAAYLISTFVAVQPDGAIQSLLAHLLYTLVFLAAAEMALDSPRSRQIIWHGILLGALLVAMTGLGGAVGLGQRLSWFPAGQNRLYTAIQYPDAAAAYLAAGCFVALSLLLTARNRWIRVGYRLAAAVCLFTFVAAASRGGTLALLPALAVFILVLGPGRRTEGVGALLLTLLAVVPAAIPYLKHLQHGGHLGRPGLLPVLEAVLLLVVMSCVLEWVWSRIEARVRPVVLGGVALLTAIGGGVGLVYELRHHTTGALGRLLHLNILKSYNAWSRLLWWRDALKMIAARPLLGWGGNGWTAAYQAFQSYAYSTTQVHNGWLQTWVSTGAVGFFIWLAFWALLVVAARTAYRRLAPQDRPRVAGLAAGLTVLGVHAFVDFTLSLGGISIGLWAMAGLLRSEALPPVVAEVPRAARRHPVRAPLWPAVGLFGVLAGAIVVSALRLVAIGDLTSASALAQTGRLTQALARLDGAVGADPWLANAWEVRGQVLAAEAQRMNSTSTGARQAWAQAGSSYARAVSLEPYSGLWRHAYAQYLQEIGQNSAAVAQLRAGVQDSRFDSGAYQALAVALLRQAASDIRSGQNAGAKTALSAVSSLAMQWAQLSKEIPAIAAAESQVAPTNPGIQLARGEAAAIEGRWTTAEARLGPLTTQAGQLGGEANLWLGLVDARLSQPNTAVLAAAKAGLGLATYNQEYATAMGLLGKLSG